MQLLIPSILIAAAIGLFTLYTNGQYQEIKGLQAQMRAFDDALDKAKDLKSKRDALLAKRNTFSTENVQKLERILPDNVDNIRFIIDINSVAARRNLSLNNVSLGTLSDSKAKRSTLAVGASGELVGSAVISFGLKATYDEFLVFLQDLEHSLRIVDVEKISFTPLGEDEAGSVGKYNFSMTIRTYWLH